MKTTIISAILLFASDYAAGDQLTLVQNGVNSLKSNMCSTKGTSQFKAPATDVANFKDFNLRLDKSFEEKCMKASSFGDIQKALGERYEFSYESCSNTNQWSREIKMTCYTEIMRLYERLSAEVSSFEKGLAFAMDNGCTNPSAASSKSGKRAKVLK